MSSIQSAAPGRRDQREKYPTNVNGRATPVLNVVRSCVCRSNISYRKYFVVFIIQCRKYFVIFNFVVMSDYENISTTKISGFTVLTITIQHPILTMENSFSYNYMR